MTESKQPVWLKPEEVPSLPDGWRVLTTADACIQLKPGKLFDSKSVVESGRVPVLNQSETGILGYHDEIPGVFASPDAPVVTFANHTCAMRLMKQPFSTIQNIFPKIGKPGITDTTYFYYATLGRVGLSDYKGHHPIFRQAHIPIPPLPIQQCIAGILSAYDEFIENNQRRIKILEAMARALYREWFVHFRFPGHESIPRVHSPFGEIPQGWEVKFLPDCIHINPRVTVPHDGEKPFVPMGSLSNDTMLISNIESRTGNSGAKFQNGDTLFARITPCLENGKTGFVQFLPNAQAVGFGSTEFIVLRSHTLSTEFVYLLARSDEFRSVAIKSMSGATGRQRVQEQCFNDFQIVQPTRELLDRFSTIVAPSFSLINKLHLETQNLRRTRDLLLPRLITGQVNLEGNEP